VPESVSMCEYAGGGSDDSDSATMKFGARYHEARVTETELRRRA